MTVRPIPNMVNHETNELFFDNLKSRSRTRSARKARVSHILDGLNAERTPIAAECIGDGYWFIDVAAYAASAPCSAAPSVRTRACSSHRARAYVNVEAANLMRFEACRLFDAHDPAARRPTWPSCWPPTPPWEAANACLQFHGGFGFANEYDVERKFRETRSYQVAPISTNLILSYVAEHILGLPRSF